MRIREDQNYANCNELHPPMLLAAHRREGPTPVGSLPDCCSSLRPSGGMDGARAEFAIEGSVAKSRMNTEAGDGARTHDPQLGKLMLYQLSYARNWLG